MKKLFLLAGLALGLCSTPENQAQVNINVQIGAPVMQQRWYDVDNDYYYMPDQGVYYNVQRRVYVYPDAGQWVYAPALPSRYGACSYNTVRYYRVRDRAPFMRNDYYRGRYYQQGYNNYYGGGNYRRDNGRYRGGRDWNDNNRRGRDWNNNSNNGYGYRNERR